MTGEQGQSSDGLADQQEQVVQHYAGQLRAAVSAEDGPRVAKGDGTKRAYEILNECAMELAKLNRRESDGPADEADFVH